MNTNEAAAYTNPYLQKLSGYTGRTISSWSDDILYQVPKTSDALVKGNLYLPGSEQTAGSIFIGMNTEPTKNQIDIEYRWAVYDYQTGVRTEVQGWKLMGNGFGGILHIMAILKCIAQQGLRATRIRSWRLMLL